MEHLLSVWPGVLQQIKNARYILPLSDYDGTLTPIVERPEMANLPERTRQLLQALARQPRFTMGIISGRALADIKDKVGIPGIIYAGNHGMEIEGPGLTFVAPLAEEIRLFLRSLHRVLSLAFSSISGVLIEDKGFTLSVHYRQVEEGKVKDVQEIFDNVVGSAQALGEVKVTAGKKVFEVRPAIAWDKGKAVELLIKKYGEGDRGSGLLPIYLGDDLTDEDAFRAINEYGRGISVFVGDDRRDTAAHYFLRSPAEVAEFLGVLLEQTQENLSWLGE